MLKFRIMSGVLLGGGVIAAAFFASIEVVYGILFAVTAWGSWELFGLLRGAGRPCFPVLGTLLNVGIMGGVLSVARGWCSSELFLFAPLALLVLFFAQLARLETDQGVDRVANTFFGVGYVGLCMAFFMSVLVLGDGEGRWTLLYLVAVVKATDIGAFTVGSLIGKRMFIPAISPAKSWEGVFGGVVVASVVSYFIARGMGYSVGVLELKGCLLWVTPVVLACVGIFGDLMESLIKRSIAVKDSGQSIKGMGGILDVIDSLLPAAPVLYILVKLG